MSEVKPLFLENGNLRQMSAGYKLDSSILEGSTVGRFNSQNSYSKGDIVINDIGLGPAFYEAKENLYPKAFYSGDWTAVGTAVTGNAGDQGIDGAAGADAKFLVLTADSQVFRYNSDGYIEAPEFIEVVANIQNVGDGTLQWQALGAGAGRAQSVDLFPSSGVICVSSGNRLVIPSGFFQEFASINTTHGDPILTITASKDTFSDTIRIIKLKDGENTLQGFLTNSNHTTSVGQKDFADSNSDGVADAPFVSGSPLSSAGGDFKVFRGFQELNTDNSQIVFSVDSVEPAGGANITIAADGVYTVNSISTGNVAVKLTATVTNLDLTTEVISKIYTHAVSFQGRDGTSILSGARAPISSDGLEGDFWLDTSNTVLYGPKTSSWPSVGVNLTGAGVDTDGDGFVDAMVANGYLGHNRTITRSLGCAGTVNGLLIGEAIIDTGVTFTISDGGIIIIVGEQIGSAVTPESLGDHLSGLAASGSWGDVANKPSTFPPSAHTHGISQITGLQGALTALQVVAQGYKLYISDQPPPSPGSSGDTTKNGDVWVQWS
jgi:hypothetical protein